MTTTLRRLTLRNLDRKNKKSETVTRVGASACEFGLSVMYIFGAS